MGDIKPTMFIGSSVEGKRIAETIQLALEYDVDSAVWHQGVFGLSGGTLESLVAAVDDYDFATLVLTADDLLERRDVTGPCPRDNVLFELGLFMGALGRTRTFIVHSRTKPPLLPTDLAGITPATFEERGNLTAALGPACTKIRVAIESQKLRPRLKRPASDPVNDSELHNQWNALLINDQPATSATAAYWTREALGKLNHSDALLFQTCLMDICEYEGSLYFLGPDRMSAWETLVECGLLMQPGSFGLRKGAPMEVVHGDLKLVIDARSSDMQFRWQIDCARLSRAGAHIARKLLQKCESSNRKPNIDFLRFLLQHCDKYFHIEVRRETETWSLTEFLQRE